MATSLATSAGSWAVVPMSGDPTFWQVFARAANSGTWKLATPPGVASNGGLVASADGANSLTVAVRPTQDLRYSPLAETANGGASWSTGGPINAAVAASPGALSAFGGKLVALLSNGAIEASANAGATWSTMAGPGAVAASSAAKGCGGAVRVTTISFGPAGTEVLAGGTCGTAGTTAMFTYSPGTGWQRANMPVSGQIARLTDDLAVVLGKSGLSALWRGMPSANTAQPGQTSWSASPALPVSGPIIASGALAGSAPAAGPGALAGFGAPAGTGAWVLLPGGRAATISAPAQTTSALPPWLLLPPVPAHTTTLASGPDGAVDALAVSGATLTVWRLASGSAVWSRVQTITVPLQYGSSS